ncbi:DUF58 domain-containing protein [Opitutus terrae]|uniref:DUF58 domain-containing protein n=1 Tax=Opitutus terrae (strain DSM 11246 / JCM 15787 / PB90-1) TaxID=452637 RepID=B1ZS80_OPITP|nr:DUF58 domain-containing protein [Opitutus terrae]ACB75679.1 protein of unknown function family [Opitutus terrae PB90-1]
MPSPLPTPSTTQNPLALLRQLEWRVRHAVENMLSGEYRSTFRGRGMEFDQVVRYEFGDDIRDIDWNVTARLGEPYRKKFVEEREVTLLVVFEDSPSLLFGSGAQSKREALMELAGLVMLLGAVNRDRVGFVHASPTGNVFREPVRGRGAILHAAASLLSQPPPPLGKLQTPDVKRQTENSDLQSPRSDSQPSTLASQLSASSIPWRFLSRAAPKHSVLLWLGDFPPRPQPEGWVVLQRRYQTMGFRVEDPWERNLPAQDTFAAYDPTSGRLVTLEGNSGERAAHAAWRAERETAWRALFPAPLSRLVVGTDENRLDALVRFFHARMNAR